MNVIGFYRLCIMGARFPIRAIGGVPPYTYSVKAGGIGGHISPEGMYLAPNTSGIDTIVAVDSEGTTVEYRVSVGTHLHIVADIISKEMDLSPDQIFLAQQKYTIPNDSRIYISIREVFSRPVGSSKVFDSEYTQNMVFLSNLDISIQTRSFAEFNRRHEIPLALSSVYSMGQQELNSIGIARLPLASNSVAIQDGAALPYHSNYNYNVQFKVTKTKNVEYFDSVSIGPVLVNE